MAAVVPLGVNDSFAGNISTPGEVESFQVTIPDSGRLVAGVQIGTGSSLDTRLSLLGPGGNLLIQSDGQSVANPSDEITQDVLAGTYVLEVTGLGSGTGTYTLTTLFQQATPPDQPLSVNFNHEVPWALTPAFAITGDFNGDGHQDIATADTFSNTVTVHLGLGDGTFQGPQTYAVGLQPIGIVAGDFNGDGHLDLAVTNPASGDVSVLLGNGDGTFQPEKRIAPGADGWGIAAADLAGNGHLDLIVVNRTGSVSILMGNGDGTFQPERRYAVGDFPGYVAVGDFDGDGHLDLAVSNFDSSDVSLLRGNGDGTFQPEVRLHLPPGSNPSAIVAGDFNGDGRLDLAAADTGSNDVSVLLGNGDGTFQSPVQYAAGAAPTGLVAGDFAGDGHLDLAVSNKDSDDVSVLLGRGDGTFQDQARYQAGFQPWFVVTGDFNGDGRTDLATANALSHDVSILLGLGNGTFLSDLANPRAAQVNPQGMAVGDFNRDGIPDLATVSYSGHDLFVYLGRGDGTFQEPMRFPTGSTPVWVISADVNGDGIPDLITANCFSSNISVFLGRGDGTFRPAVNYLASLFTDFAVAGDFTGDGHVDLITGGDLVNQFAFLQGKGDGTFQPAQTFNLPYAGAEAAVGDFDGRLDAHGKPILDLAVTNFFDPKGSISILFGRGDGSFEPPVYYPVGSQPLGIVARDFGNGHLDLAVADSGSNDVSVLLGRGDGTFAPAVRYAVGVAPDSIGTADFNGDGHVDLAVTNGGSTYMSLLLGRGDGTFAPQLQSAVTDPPTPHRGLVIADFNGDGRLDLATPELLTSNDISVLLGNGDGTFQAPIHFAVGLGPVAQVSGDFTDAGRRDIASVDPTTNEVAVALGVGDGTLQAPVYYSVGNTPIAIVTGDFNGDGRLDLAIANFASNDVSVLLGLGDGTFRPEQRYAVGTNPTSIAAGDFNGDGHLDLAITNSGSNDISVLFGQGDGTFKDQVRLAAPDMPQALVAGNFGNGHIDLATANYRSQDVSVFLGRGDGTFQAPVRYAALGSGPVALIMADLTGDGHLDLATANFRSHDVSVLLGRGDGTFQAPIRYDAGSSPLALAAGDFSGDGHVDLTVADSTANAVALLFGRGDGTFASPVLRPVAAYPRALIADDFNNDGRTDLAVATQFSRDVSVLMGLGDGTFLNPDSISNEIHATPLVADLNGDGVSDVAVINRAGQILLRYGRPDSPGTFDPPIVLNPNPRSAVRELARFRTSQSTVLAALDAHDPAISFYARGLDGTFTRTRGPVVPGILPVRLTSGDLNGNGRDDLVVAATGTNQVFVYLQHTDGAFGPMPDYQIGVGVNPSAITLADVNGDGLLDIVVTNQFSGDVSVLLNDPDPKKAFCSVLRFRAGIGLYWVDQQNGSPVIHSFQGSAGVVSGRFDEAKSTGLVVVNSSSNSFSLLQGTVAGGFLNPQAAQTFATGIRPTAVVVGDFNNDGHLDLAILNEGSGDISIFFGDGHGGFTEKLARDANGQPIRLSAGYLPTGLAVADINGDGKLDLLVGNDFGDVLILRGNGDGTFQPYQRTERNVALAVADLTGKGTSDFIFADEALDRVTVQYAQPGQTFVQGRTDGLLAPGAVKVADLNGDGIPDLIVANSGSNEVRVYLGLGNGQFGPAHRFFTGTNPTGVTVAYLNDDLVADPTDPSHQRLVDLTPDLVVANQGSNDVTVLFGQGQGSNWTFEPGPRLDAHGLGPVSTAVRYVADPKGGVALPDLLVANSQSNNVTQLPGVGRGFFDDRNPQILSTGIDPQQILVGHFVSPQELDLVTINAGSNDLTFFRDFGSRESISSGGDMPVAAIAGDFNHNGIDDLIVANNGDGRESLFLGSVDGLAFSRSFSSEDVPHPTALAIALVGNSQNVYVVNEATDAAVLLTTFASPIPSSAGSDLRRPIADVFVLQGPGFSKALDVPSIPGPQVSEELRQLSEAEISVLLIAPLLVGGADPPIDDQPDVPHPDNDLESFIIGQQASTGRWPESSSGREIEQPIAPEAVDEVFQQWPSVLGDEPSSAQQDLAGASLPLLRDVAIALRSRVKPIAGEISRIPDTSLPNVVDAHASVTALTENSAGNTAWSNLAAYTASPNSVLSNSREDVPSEPPICPEQLTPGSGGNASLIPLTKREDESTEGMARTLATAVVFAQIFQAGCAPGVDKFARPSLRKPE
jgi:hypothetical protein